MKELAKFQAGAELCERIFLETLQRAVVDCS